MQFQLESLVIKTKVSQGPKLVSYILQQMMETANLSLFYNVIRDYYLVPLLSSSSPQPLNFFHKDTTSCHSAFLCRRLLSFIYPGKSFIEIKIVFIPKHTDKKETVEVEFYTYKKQPMGKSLDTQRWPLSNRTHNSGLHSSQ